MDNLNPNSSAVRRLQRELIELSRNPPDMFTAAPLDDNLFEWHFTIRGGDDTAFAGGLYHGRILLPPTYPHKPPDVVFLTPNGRFKINEKICLSITGYHPEHWSAVWDIRAALTALIAFLPTPPNGAIGSLDYSNEERAMLAKKSVNYCCKTCGIPNSELLEICGEGETKDIQKKAVGKSKGGKREDASQSRQQSKQIDPSERDGKQKKDKKDLGEGKNNIRSEDEAATSRADTKHEDNSDYSDCSSRDQDRAISAAKESVATVSGSNDMTSWLVVLLSVLIAILLARKYGRYHGWIE